MGIQNDSAILEVDLAISSWKPAGKAVWERQFTDSYPRVGKKSVGGWGLAERREIYNWYRVHPL